jgi:hypothetical protein
MFRIQNGAGLRPFLDRVENFFGRLSRLFNRQDTKAQSEWSGATPCSQNSQDDNEGGTKVAKPEVFGQSLCRSIGTGWDWRGDHGWGRGGDHGIGAGNGIGAGSRCFVNRRSRAASCKHGRGDKYDWNDVAHRVTIQRPMLLLQPSCSRAYGIKLANFKQVLHRKKSAPGRV